jgi:hypothetical protein
MDHSTKLEMIRLKCISDSLKNIFVTKTKTNHNTVPGVYIYISNKPYMEQNMCQPMCLRNSIKKEMFVVSIKAASADSIEQKHVG